MNYVPVNLIEIITIIGSSIIAGGLIGIERQNLRRPAGLRTHIIVCVGAAIVMYTDIQLSKQYLGFTNVDPARIGAQVVSGLGFIGAGTILREGVNVKGLTTAATIWSVGCIGLAIGAGFIEMAFLTTATLFIVLHFLLKLEDKAEKFKRLAEFYIEVRGRDTHIDAINEKLKDLGCIVKSLKVKEVREQVLSLKMVIKLAPDMDFLMVTSALATIDGIVTVEKIDT